MQKAYDLRDKVSEREKFRISANYYLLVTGELEKAIQTYETWAQTYPRNNEPCGNLGVDYTYLGQYESAVNASLGRPASISREALLPLPTWSVCTPH